MTQAALLLSRRADILAEVSAIMNEPWDPVGKHCWSVTTRIVALFGYTLPPVIEIAPEGGKEARDLRLDLFASHPERRKWRKTEVPTDWAIVLMHHKARPPEAIEHSGVFLNIDGGRVLHSDHPHGVVLDLPQDLLNVRRWSPIYVVPNE